MIYNVKAYIKFKSSMKQALNMMSKMLVKSKVREISIRRPLCRSDPFSFSSTSSPDAGYISACFSLAFSLNRSTPPYTQMDGMSVGGEDP